MPHLPPDGPALNISNSPDSIRHPLTDLSGKVALEVVLHHQVTSYAKSLLLGLQHDMGELGLLILEKAYGRFDTVRPASLDKLQFTQVSTFSILPHHICLQHMVISSPIPTASASGF